MPVIASLPSPSVQGSEYDGVIYTAGHQPVFIMLKLCYNMTLVIAQHRDPHFLPLAIVILKLLMLRLCNRLRSLAVGGRLGISALSTPKSSRHVKS